MKRLSVGVKLIVVDAMLRLNFVQNERFLQTADNFVDVLNIRGLISWKAVSNDSLIYVLRAS